MKHPGITRTISLLLAGVAITAFAQPQPQSHRPEEDWPSGSPIPPQIQFPPAQSFASGVVHIKAAADPSVQVEKASFYYRAPLADSLVLIGTDVDGADDIFNTFQPARTGDGWSAYWDTRELRPGTYLLLARMFTSSGIKDAKTTVYVTQTPPIPFIENPRFGETVEGRVQIRTRPVPGLRAVFELRNQAEVITFPVEPTNQHEFPFDGNEGKMMCDPSSQAAILWKYKKVRDRARRAAAKACRGKTEDAFDVCAKREFIGYLAKKKGTNKDGTGYGNEGTGSTAALDELGMDGWALVQSGNKSQVSFKQLKTFSSQPAIPGKVKGVLVHVHRKSNPGGTGHVLAVVSINDKTDKNGKREVHLMDPDTGKEVTIHVGDEGEFTYPEPNGEASIIDSMSKFVGPPSDKVAVINQAPALTAKSFPRISIFDRRSAHAVVNANVFQGTFSKQSAEARAEGWTTISISNRANPRGWTAIWDSRGFQRGFYWIRVTVTDASGHSGSDLVEVLLR